MSVRRSVGPSVHNAFGHVFAFWPSRSDICRVYCLVWSVNGLKKKTTPDAQPQVGQKSENVSFRSKDRHYGFLVVIFCTILKENLNSIHHDIRFLMHSEAKVPDVSSAPHAQGERGCTRRKCDELNRQKKVLAGFF